MTTSRSIGTTGCRLRVLPMCPERLCLFSGLPSPVEAGLWYHTQGSRYGNHHATSRGTSRRIGTITWDIAANRHHYEQSKLCHMQLSQNDWLNVIRSCVNIQQNCQEACQELCRNFGAVDRSIELWQAVKSKPQMWATKRCDLVDTSSSISI